MATYEPAVIALGMFDGVHLGHRALMSRLQEEAKLLLAIPAVYTFSNHPLEVLGGNVAYACDFIDRELDGVSVRRPEGTYMLFVDCGEYCRANGRTLDEVKRTGIEVGVLWQDGRPFHGASHLRMNLALPRDRMIEAFDRLKKHVFV